MSKICTTAIPPSSDLCCIFNIVCLPRVMFEILSKRLLHQPHSLYSFMLWTESFGQWTMPLSRPCSKNVHSWLSVISNTSSEACDGKFNKVLQSFRHNFDFRRKQHQTCVGDRLIAKLLVVWLYIFSNYPKGAVCSKSALFAIYAAF